MPLASKIAGKRIDTFVVIMDFKDASVTKFFDNKIRDYLLKLDKICADYYPEVVAKICIINAPFQIYAIYGLFKPFIPTETKNKVIIEREGKGSQDLLYKYIENNQLPIFMGGNLDMNKPERKCVFSAYTQVCNEMESYYPEPNVCNPDQNIYPSDDPFIRAQTIDLNIGKTILASNLRHNQNLLNGNIFQPQENYRKNSTDKYEKDFSFTSTEEQPIEHKNLVYKPVAQTCAPEKLNAILFNRN